MNHNPDDDTTAGTATELEPVPGDYYAELRELRETETRHAQHQQTAQDAKEWLRANLHKTDGVLVRDALLLLGYPRAAAAHMATTGDQDAGTIYAALAAPAIEPTAVHTPGRRRKAVAKPAAKPAVKPAAAKRAIEGSEDKS